MEIGVNMPMYSAPEPRIRTQTMLKYAYVFSTRARSPDPDNVEICLRIQHPSPESGPRQYWNMPTYSAPGFGVRTQTILKSVALKNALKNDNVCAQEWVIGGNLSARFWLFGFKTLKIFRPVYLHQHKKFTSITSMSNAPPLSCAWNMWFVMLCGKNAQNFPRSILIICTVSPSLVILSVGNSL